MPEPYEADQAWAPTVIAFDPGGTTGWCVMSVHPDSLLSDEVSILENIIYCEQGELEGDEMEQADAIAELLDAWDSAAILSEDFQIRTLAAELSPVRITAIMTYMAQHYWVPARPVFLQMPSMRVTDERLKAWGIYTPGAHHARDAKRHVVAFLRRAKENRKLREAAWPTIYGQMHVAVDEPEIVG